MFREERPSIKGEIEKLDQQDVNDKQRKKELLMANIAMVEDTLNRFEANPEYEQPVRESRALLQKYRDELADLMGK